MCEVINQWSAVPAYPSFNLPYPPQSFFILPLSTRVSISCKVKMSMRYGARKFKKL